MSTDAWVEMAKQVPAALAVVLVVMLFLKAEDTREIRRIANAKEIGDTQRAHEVQLENARRGRELEINNLWASTVKNLMDSQNKANEAIVDAVADLKKTTMEQYSKLGITQDLFKSMKDDLRNKT